MKSAILALAAGLVLLAAPDARTQTAPALPEDPGAVRVLTAARRRLRACSLQTESLKGLNRL